MAPYRLVLLLPLALLGGCLYGIGRCTYETRSITLQGTLTGTTNGQPDSGTVTIGLAEAKGSASYRTLSVQISTFLAGAIASVEVRDHTRPASPPLIVITGFPGSPGQWSANLSLTSSTPSYIQLQIPGEGRRLELVVRIGSGGSTGTLSGIVYVTSDEGWTRPYCD
ncbi:MAG: hypothetical protein ABI613_07105 [Gemmatimonadota bacterium]